MQDSEQNYKLKFLKVKSKSLAEESRIIRKEESRAKKNNQLREELHLHRINDVRVEARATHLAYAFLRGKAYKDTEKGERNSTYWFNHQYLVKRVEKMVEKYGAHKQIAELAEWLRS